MQRIEVYLFVFYEILHLLNIPRYFSSSERVSSNLQFKSHYRLPPSKRRHQGLGEHIRQSSILSSITIFLGATGYLSRNLCTISHTHGISRSRRSGLPNTKTFFIPRAFNWPNTRSIYVRTAFDQARNLQTCLHFVGIQAYVERNLFPFAREICHR